MFCTSQLVSKWSLSLKMPVPSPVCFSDMSKSVYLGTAHDSVDRRLDKPKYLVTLYRVIEKLTIILILCPALEVCWTQQSFQKRLSLLHRLQSIVQHSFWRRKSLLHRLQSISPSLPPCKSMPFLLDVVHVPICCLQKNTFPTDWAVYDQWLFGQGLKQLWVPWTIVLLLRVVGI